MSETIVYGKQGNGKFPPPSTVRRMLRQAAADIDKPIAITPIGGGGTALLKEIYPKKSELPFALEWPLEQSKVPVSGEYKPITSPLGPFVKALDENDIQGILLMDNNSSSGASVRGGYLFDLRAAKKRGIPPKDIVTAVAYDPADIADYDANGSKELGTCRSIRKYSPRTWATIRREKLLPDDYLTSILISANRNTMTLKGDLTLSEIQKMVLAKIDLPETDVPVLNMEIAEKKIAREVIVEKGNYNILHLPIGERGIEVSRSFLKIFDEYGVPYESVPVRCDSGRGIVTEPTLTDLKNLVDKLRHDQPHREVLGLVYDDIVLEKSTHDSLLVYNWLRTHNQKIGLSDIEIAVAVDGVGYADYCGYKTEAVKSARDKDSCLEKLIRKGRLPDLGKSGPIDTTRIKPDHSIDMAGAFLSILNNGEKALSDAEISQK